MREYAVRYEQGVKHQTNTRQVIRSMALSILSSIKSGDRSNFLKCVYCHYVFDDQIALFESKVKLMMSAGKFVDTSTALDMIEGKRPVDGQFFHLSFDDGFKNVVKNALPILDRYRVPSLFFVPTAFVGAPYEKVADYCVRIAEYGSPIEMCSWDDLKRARDSGMEIGSHTRTHARFSEISSSPSLLMEEFAGSKNDIESILGVPCTTISWPYGRMDDADEISVRATQRAGDRACFGAFRGAVRNGGCDPFMIPRHHFETQWPDRHVQYFMFS